VAAAARNSAAALGSVCVFYFSGVFGFEAYRACKALPKKAAREVENRMQV
jgi:hypothetical protein